MAEKPAFGVADIVRLNSGTLRMTVHSVREAAMAPKTIVECIWHDDDGSLQAFEYFASQLIMVKSWAAQVAAAGG
jgi:uncharacterized protein YodC (DUF2158 family)